MLSRITIFTSFIAIVIILLSSFMAFATANTFSVYGSIQEQDGTPVPNATLKLIEPIDDTYSTYGPSIRSTVTDSNGDFQFINVTTNVSECGITIFYPDKRDDINPGNYFRLVNASGVQYVNITRIAGSDATPSSSTSLTIFIFGLVGLFVIRRKVL